MQKNELASIYLTEYAGADVLITAESDIVVTSMDVYNDDQMGLPAKVTAFDLSDGTHWFADDNDVVRVEESLVDAEIGWDATDGYVVIEDDGRTHSIRYV